MSIDYFARVVQEDLNVGADLTTKRNPAGGTLTATQVGIHTFAVGQLAVYTTWAPGEVTAGGTVSDTISVPGAALGDFVLAAFGASLQGMAISGYVQADNEVIVVIANNTGTMVTLTSNSVAVLVFKARSVQEEGQQE
jgi:hypothetical protein